LLIPTHEYSWDYSDFGIEKYMVRDF
jgi:hypothetical protein